MLPSHLITKASEIERQYRELFQQLETPRELEIEEFNRAIVTASELGVTVQIFESWQKAIADRIELELMTIAPALDREFQTLATQELLALDRQITDLEYRLKVALLPQDPLDRHHALIEITAGAGGDEAGIWASDLVRQYERYAGDRGWKARIVSENYIGGDFRKAWLEIIGDRVYSQLKFESGIHQVQRLPVTIDTNKLQTSTATITVMPAVDEWSFNIDPQDLEINYCGLYQGRPTLNYNGVMIAHKPTAIKVFCEMERNQRRNKERALQILSTKLHAIELQRQQESIEYFNRDNKNPALIPLVPLDRSIVRIYNYLENRIIDRRLPKQFTCDKLDAIVRGCIDRDLGDRIAELENLEDKSKT